jgi:hypothetical protein
MEWPGEGPAVCSGAAATGDAEDVEDVEDVGDVCSCARTGAATDSRAARLIVEKRAADFGMAVHPVGQAREQGCGRSLPL